MFITEGQCSVLHSRHGWLSNTVTMLYIKGVSVLPAEMLQLQNPQRNFQKSVHLLMRKRKTSWHTELSRAELCCAVLIRDKPCRAVPWFAVLHPAELKRARQCMPGSAVCVCCVTPLLLWRHGVMPSFLFKAIIIDPHAGTPLACKSLARCLQKSVCPLCAAYLMMKTAQ